MHTQRHQPPAQRPPAQRRAPVPRARLSTPRLAWLGMLASVSLLVSACTPGEDQRESRATAAPPPPQAAPVDLDLVALTAPELAELLAAGSISSQAVTRAYLERIASLDDSGPRLNAIIDINPGALDIARELDAALAASGPVGPLHGLPVVLKANIGTADGTATSAGSQALANHHSDDAFHVARLRAAGAVILAKANLSEWANFRDEKSSSGWSSVGGQTKNPYVLDRNPCGSSSGSAVAVAASLAPLAVGTETNGSVVCPAGINGIVGIKPSLGTVSRTGIIPLAHSQDTAGPMAKTVTGAALLLEAMVGFDEADKQAVRFAGDNPQLQPDPGQTRLAGRRIGVYRSYFGAGEFPRVEAIFDDSVGVLSDLGATIIDPIRYERDEATRAAQYNVLLYEFKADLNAYLAASNLPNNVNSLADLIEYNRANAATVMPVFGQSIFLDAQAKGDLINPEYLDALAVNNLQMRADLTALLDEHELDALFIPVNGPAWKIDWIQGDRYSFGGTASLAAISGFPSIVLPAGDVSGLPIAVGFVGRALADAELIQMAYAFEQATHARRPPQFIPTLEHD